MLVMMLMILMAKMLDDCDADDAGAENYDDDVDDHVGHGDDGHDDDYDGDGDGSGGVDADADAVVDDEADEADDDYDLFALQAAIGATSATEEEPSWNKKGSKWSLRLRLPISIIATTATVCISDRPIAIVSSIVISFFPQRSSYRYAVSDRPIATMTMMRLI